MQKEYVLITGATGFIGSHVIERLLSHEEYEVVAIVRKATNYKNTDRLRSRGAILVEGNFYDRRILDDTFTKFPIRHVIHLAAVRGVGTAKRAEYYEVNVSGTEVLLEHSLRNRIRKFIFCSSVGVFGTIPKELPANPRTDLHGDNDYHHSKIIAEKKVEEFIDKGLDAFIVRPTITYGKGDNGFPCTLVKLIRRRLLLLPLKRNRIHLLDVNKLAEVFVKILGTESIGNRTLLVADEAPVFLQEMADLVSFYFREKHYPRFLKLPTSAFHSILFLVKTLRNEKWISRIQLVFKDWHFDTSEMSSLLGVEPANTKNEFVKFLDTIPRC